MNRKDFFALAFGTGLAVCASRVLGFEEPRAIRPLFSEDTAGRKNHFEYWDLSAVGLSPTEWNEYAREVTDALPVAGCFRPGDVVQLWAHDAGVVPTPMTVEEDLGDAVRCVWFDNETLYRQEFCVGHLCHATAAQGPH